MSDYKMMNPWIKHPGVTWCKMSYLQGYGGDQGVKTEQLA